MIHPNMATTLGFVMTLYSASRGVDGSCGSDASSVMPASRFRDVHGLPGRRLARDLDASALAFAHDLRRAPGHGPVTDRAVQARHDSVFPWGTLTVNVVGSFVLGVLTAAAVRGAVGSGVVAAVGTGFCGALTTYSTFSYETLRLAEDGAGFEAVANVVVSLVAGLTAAALGWAVGTALS